MDLAKALWIYTRARCICKHLEGAVLRTWEGPISSWASRRARIGAIPLSAIGFEVTR